MNNPTQYTRQDNDPIFVPTQKTENKDVSAFLTQIAILREEVQRLSRRLVSSQSDVATLSSQVSYLQRDIANMQKRSR